MRRSQGEFQYGPDLLNSLENSISGDRLGTYLRASGHDLHRELFFYTFGTQGFLILFIFRYNAPR